MQSQGLGILVAIMMSIVGFQGAEKRSEEKLVPIERWMV